jgi:rubrerythrin
MEPPEGEPNVDIFDYALDREKDSEAYYRRLATECSVPGLKAILTRLADAEVRHQHIVAKMRTRETAKVEEDPFLQEVKGLFTSLRDRGEKLDVAMSAADLYRKAQVFEKESWDMYQKAAEAAPTDAARTILHRLAVQEKVHYQIVGTLVELVSRPEPGNWLEFAEWYHLDQY